MKILIFGLLFTGFFLLFHKMESLNRLAGLLRRTRSEMDAASRQRSLADRQKLLKLQERNSFWYKLEQQLLYSGIKAKLPGITPERWVAAHLMLGAGLMLPVAVAGGIVSATAVAALAFTIECVLLKALRRRNLKRTENGLTKLLDFLGNYSVVSGDVTGVLGQISRYMEEPIKGALDACYYDAAITGDAAMALLVMAERVEHPKFKELARNMEISVRYCADFSALVNSSRRSLREYLHMARARRGMQREAAVNLILLALMSGVMLMVVSKLTGISVTVLLTGRRA